MSSSEAELDGLFNMASKGKIICIIMIEFGNPQPPTPLHTENSTPAVIVNNTFKLQISWSIDLNYFWLIYQVYQRIFQYNGHQDLKIFLNTTWNTSTLHITAVCDHLFYNYGISLYCYQYQRHLLCFNDVLKPPQVMTIKLQVDYVA